MNPGGTFKNVLRLSPPLVITEEQLDRGIDVLDESIKAVKDARQKPLAETDLVVEEATTLAEKARDPESLSV